MFCIINYCLKRILFDIFFSLKMVMIIFLPLFIVTITALIYFCCWWYLYLNFFAVFVVVLIFSVVWTYYLALWHLIWLLFLWYW